MTTCYLCGSQAQISGQDYGRRKIVRCSSKCGYYEVDNVALSKIDSPDCPPQIKSALLEAIVKIANSGREAEIVFDGSKLIPREKQN